MAKKNKLMSIEFIKNYAWWILLVLVIVAVLAHFDLFPSPSLDVQIYCKNNPDKCVCIKSQYSYTDYSHCYNDMISKGYEKYETSKWCKDLFDKYCIKYIEKTFLDDVCKKGMLGYKPINKTESECRKFLKDAYEYQFVREANECDKGNPDWILDCPEDFIQEGEKCKKSDNYTICDSVLETCSGGGTITTGKICRPKTIRDYTCDELREEFYKEGKKFEDTSRFDKRSEIILKRSEIILFLMEKRCFR
jgi:hypothetical protein